MPRIALVEDNPDNRLLVVTLLEDDYSIDEYEDGATALDGIAANRPDLILLDISLPGMDGAEVLERLKDTDARGIPTIALTAHAMDGDREKYLGLGFDGYLSKPIVDESQLFEAIDSLLAR
jgi:CheY-like chemotaxis protein